MSPAAVLVLVLLVLVAVVLVLLFRWPGWLRSSGPAVAPPATPPNYPRALRAPTEGTYGGTERAADGQLVRAHGLGNGGRVQLILAAEGLVLDRQGLNDLLIEEHELLGAEERSGRLVVRWRHEGVVLETAVELDAAGEVASWVASLEQMGRMQ
ncbi:MAG: hypothetical protein GEV07_01960 [Streptosporangiales bacterium]|nr:hypothetical protein [Streptosporangiales bacterium]